MQRLAAAPLEAEYDPSGVWVSLVPGRAGRLLMMSIIFIGNYLAFERAWALFDTSPNLNATESATSRTVCCDLIGS